MRHQEVVTLAKNSSLVLRVKKNGNVFIYLPIEQQVKEILADEKLYKHLTNRDMCSSMSTGNITDVTSAMLYKELITKHSFSENDLSLTWNTDDSSN